MIIFSILKFKKRYYLRHVIGSCSGDVILYLIYMIRAYSTHALMLSCSNQINQQRINKSTLSANNLQASPLTGQALV